MILDCGGKEQRRHRFGNNLSRRPAEKRRRASLADALRRLQTAGISLDGASDHGVSEALYLHDPDNNGVELYWDRPKELWPKDENDELTMFMRQLDVNSLLKEI